MNIVHSKWMDDARKEFMWWNYISFYVKIKWNAFETSIHFHGTFIAYLCGDMVRYGYCVECWMLDGSSQYTDNTKSVFQMHNVQLKEFHFDYVS